MTAEALADHFGSIDALHTADPEQIEEVEGVGPIMAVQIAESLADERTWALVEKLREKGLRLEQDPSERRASGGPLEGKTFVLTGTLPELTREEAGCADQIGRRQGRQLGLEKNRLRRRRREPGLEASQSREIRDRDPRRSGPAELARQVTTVRLDIEYDGAGFKGWAKQAGLRTVQEEIETALATVLREPVELTVAGRTDTGVHARGQVASFATAAEVPGDLARRANGLGPRDIALTQRDGSRGRLRRPPRRRSPAPTATACSLAAHRAPSSRAAPSGGPTGLTAKPSTPAPIALPGTHDFTAFTPTQTDHVHFDRKILAAQLDQRGDILSFEVTADAFMRNMVRVLVGTMLDVSSHPPNPRRTSRSSLTRRPALGRRRHRSTPRPVPGISLVRLKRQREPSDDQDSRGSLPNWRILKMTR